MSDNTLLREIDILYISRKIRFLGIAILIGIFLIYGMGVFVSASNVNPEMELLNLITFIFCIILCAFAVLMKRTLISKLLNNFRNTLKANKEESAKEREKFAAAYFNAHVIPFGLCDLGGIICITTSLFLNQNLIYATVGFLLTIAAMILIFPGNEEYKNINK